MKNIFASKPMIALEIALIAFFSFHVAKQFLERKRVEQEVARMEQEIEKLENKNDDLGALLEYAKTDTFIEREAREKLNLVKEGESLVLIPEVDADASLSSADKDQDNPRSAILGDSHVKLCWEYFFDYDQLWVE